MNIRYYLSVFPTESLVASNLDPESYGAYMATGTKNGSYERIIFIEVESGYDRYFDWTAAQIRCHAHEDGRPKNSVWLSVYRALEHTPLKAMGKMYLTTANGKTLALNKTSFSEDDHSPYYVYNELCPITPLVVSKYNPEEFCNYMTDPANKVSVPRVVFADLKAIDPDHPDAEEHMGKIYQHNVEHFKQCIQQVLSLPEKPNKNVERSYVDSFSYAMINRGIFVGDRTGMLHYTLPPMELILRNNYDWAVSVGLV